MNKSLTSNEIARGFTLIDQGKSAEAKLCFKNVLKAKPEEPQSLCGMGIIAFNDKSFSDAQAYLKAACEHKNNPRKPSAFFFLAMTHEHEGQLGLALKAYKASISLNANMHQSFSRMGHVFEKLNQNKKALDCHLKALKIKPNNPRYLHNVGLSYKKNYNFNMALIFYDQVLKLDPDNVECLNNCGTVHRYKKNYDEALSLYQRALSLKPDYLDCLTNVAVLYQAKEEYDKAEATFKQVLKMDSEHTGCLNNLAVFYQLLGNYDKAIPLIEKALKKNPDNTKWLSNIAVCYLTKGDFIRSKKYLKKAIKLLPNYQPALLNMSMIHLLHGDFAKGWPLYESRKENKQHVGMNKFIGKIKNAVEWDGKASLKNKNILLVKEQGFGDYIFFIRFAEKLHQLGATVFLDCPVKLKRLFSNLTFIKGYYQESIKVDYYIPIMSLAYKLGVNEKTIPNVVPYLFANKLKVKKMSRHVNHASLNIGLAWAGSRTNVNDINRSMKLSSLLPLFDNCNVSLVNLQIDNRLNDIDEKIFNERFINVVNDIEDFADTAALIKNLDLVISVDTAVAHLTGALGIDCWVMLPHVPDWRWQLDKNYSPWYPQMKLFRQVKLGDWQFVIEQIRERLDEFIENKKMEKNDGRSD